MTKYAIGYVAVLLLAVVAIAFTGVTNFGIGPRVLPDMPDRPMPVETPELVDPPFQVLVVGDLGPAEVHAYTGCWRTRNTGMCSDGVTPTEDTGTVVTAGQDQFDLEFLVAWDLEVTVIDEHGDCAPQAASHLRTRALTIESGSSLSRVEIWAYNENGDAYWTFWIAPDRPGEGC